MISRRALSLLFLLLISGSSHSGISKDSLEPAGIPQVSSLWREPVDIESRDLRFGSGGLDHVPQEPFVFLKEDLRGTNPKFEIRDSAGTKWKVKLGVEARPEVAASRLIWASGYFTPDNYYVPILRVQNMPDHLRRGQELVGADGIILGARLKCIPGTQKIGIWKWRHNPFTGTRELNGLRVLMALISNVDLKDVNNAVVQTSEPGQNQAIYMVSDLGSSFSGAIWPLDLKGNLEAYRQSKFILDTNPDTVDFHLATGPTPSDLARLPWYLYRTRLRWIGKDIPRADARWIGEIMSRLSPDQIRDAFRCSGYSSDEADGFTAELLERIATLRSL